MPRRDRSIWVLVVVALAAAPLFLFWGTCGSARPHMIADRVDTDTGIGGYGPDSWLIVDGEKICRLRDCCDCGSKGGTTR